MLNFDMLPKRAVYTEPTDKHNVRQLVLLYQRNDQLGGALLSQDGTNFSVLTLNNPIPPWNQTVWTMPRVFDPGNRNWLALERGVQRVGRRLKDTMTVIWPSNGARLLLAHHADDFNPQGVNLVTMPMQQ